MDQPVALKLLNAARGDAPLYEATVLVGGITIGLRLARSHPEWALAVIDQLDVEGCPTTDKTEDSIISAIPMEVIDAQD